MPVIRPHRVTLKPTGEAGLAAGTWLAYAPSAERAMLRAITYYRKPRQAHWVTAKLAKEGFLSAVVLHPWRVSALRGPSGRLWLLHAADREEARVLAAQALTSRPEDLYVEECSDFEVLETLPDEMLEHQCYMVWGVATASTSELATRVPNLRRRKMRDYGGRKKQRMEHPTRLQCIYALALAQKVEAVGPEWRRGLNRPKNLANRATSLKNRAKRLHADNVGNGILKEMFDAGFHREPEPFTAEQRTALARFARAYGLDPEKTGVWGAWHLWTNGSGVIA